MRDPRETARRWMEQAEHDLEVTKAHVDNAFWSDACFMAEQTAQVALKAYLYGQGERFIPIHSVYELALECTKKDAAFKRLVDPGKVLDKYYIPARYPDALAPPGVPYKVFIETEGRQALSYAEDIVSMVKARI